MFQRELEILSEQARHGSLVLFVGAGVSKDAGLPDWSNLLRPLAAELGVEASTDPLDVAQWYAVANGRTRLLDYVRTQISKAPAPGPLHRSLATIPAPVFFTTNYDQLLERAIAEVQHVPPDVIVEDAHVGLIDETRRTTVVKLHGCLSVPETIVLARDEYEAYADRHPAMIAYLQSLLATRTFLFVGTSLSDPNFLVIQAAIRRALGKYQRHAYRLDAGAKKDYLVEYWRQRGIQMLLFPDYNGVREFVDAIGRAANEGRTIRSATEILAREAPSPRIDPDWLLRGARDLESALLRTIEQARVHGLLSRERTTITEAATDGDDSTGGTLRQRRIKVRALLSLAEAIDVLSPVASHDVWNDLGDSLYALGDANGAIQAYNRLLGPSEGRHAVEPSRLLRNRGNLARCYAREGHHARAEWLLRQCVFKAGQDVHYGPLDRPGVFKRLNLEHLEQRPTDASEFVLAVSRRAERLRESGHAAEAFEALREARYTLEPLLGLRTYVHDCFSRGYAAGRVERQWVPGKYSYPRAWAFNFLGKCYRLSCSLALDLNKGAKDVAYYLRWAECYLKRASEFDARLPNPYLHRLLLEAELRLPISDRRRLLDEARHDLEAVLRDTNDKRLIGDLLKNEQLTQEAREMLRTLQS